jgi:general secretion pathway protein G
MTQARRRKKVLIAVLAGMGTLVVAALVLVQVVRRQGYDRRQRARHEVQVIASSVDAFRVLHGRYPTAEEGLGVLLREDFLMPNALEPGAPVGALHDPWGHRYVYAIPGRVHTVGFDVTSYGADGKPGGEDDDADIVNAP